MIIYDSTAQYLETSTSLEDRLAKIEAIIDGLLVAAENAVGKEYITEYSLNDGQTQIRTVYRGMEAIAADINKWEAIKQIYINRLNGNRVKRLMDSQNFHRGC